MGKRRLIYGLMKQMQSFEAAARHGSFTAAAQELGVSQPAVSLSVRQLETDLGFDLFQRVHKAIHLTPPGRELYLEARSSLDNLERCVQGLYKSRRGQHVTLSCSTAFANHWFIPRLGQFQSAHPTIDLRVQTTDRDLDLHDDNADLSVRRGDGRWPGYSGVRLADDILFPVAAPSYASTGQWSTQRLIHLDEPNRPRPGWQDFFMAMGIETQELPPGLRLNDYALVLQAAIAGEGIALGWAHIVERPIAAGQLIQVDPAQWQTNLGHDLIWSNSADLSPQARAVKDWILTASTG